EALEAEHAREVRRAELAAEDAREGDRARPRPALEIVQEDAHAPGGPRRHGDEVAPLEELARLRGIADPALERGAIDVARRHGVLEAREVRGLAHGLDDVEAALPRVLGADGARVQRRPPGGLEHA